MVLCGKWFYVAKSGESKEKRRKVAKVAKSGEELEKVVKSGEKW